MNRTTLTWLYGLLATGDRRRHEGAGVASAYKPPPSDVPAAEPATSADAVVPHPAADVGGLDNLPEEWLSAADQVQDELDHAGLDVELPGEDASSAPGKTPPATVWIRQ